MLLSHVLVIINIFRVRLGFKTAKTKDCCRRRRNEETLRNRLATTTLEQTGNLTVLQQGRCAGREQTANRLCVRRGRNTQQKNLRTTLPSVISTEHLLFNRSAQHLNARTERTPSEGLPRNNTSIGLGRPCDR